MYKNPKETEYASWWNKTISDAGLADNRYQLKGFFVWMPYGFSIMKNIRNKWDYLFALNGIQEMYFPLLVPVEYASRNASWWNSFKSQAFYALGYEETEKNAFLRPTGEPAMYPMFSTWIRSHRDLPLRIYETVSSFRNETKSTKTFVRDVEIGPWYEIHTCHATREEAENEIKLAIKMNEELFLDAAIASIKVRKPPADCFPGSVGAVEFYTTLNDKLIENASCNNLGQAYAKAFDIAFTDKDEQKKPVWQTCTGNGERILAAIIGNHSDDKGIVVPPKIAPLQAALIIINSPQEEVLDKIDLGIDKSKILILTAKAFSEIGELRFKAERMGIPARIEIGPKELLASEATLISRAGNKKSVPFKNLKAELAKLLEKLQNDLYDASKKELFGRIKECDKIEEAEKAQVALVGWCGKTECSDWIKTKTKKDLIGMTLEIEKKKCIWCGEDGEKTYFSAAY
ncbi:Proline--tRNA ligase [uncultured archaeon]|nr:Proline--tRNA ligase [uncultured archaeon]